MLNIIGARKVWFALSGVLFIASIAAIAVWGLRFGIDFTGGSITELHFLDTRPDISLIAKSIEKSGVEDAVLQPAGDNDLFVRTKTLDQAAHQKMVEELVATFKTTDNKPAVEERSFESIGPTVGAELKQKSWSAIAMVLLAIILFIAWAFRKVSEPVASWKFGVCAVLALFHDVIIPTGIFAMLGHFLGYEIDTLFVTAILTVLGFSVHDTIVVFDRIRENLIKHGGVSFAETVNVSVNETMRRSINTSFTVLLVLLAVFFFGGESTKNFVLVLILGVFFGTYSSIFIASPLLVAWQEWQRAKGKR
jgi:preprotein translocase subunit SecF